MSNINWGRLYAQGRCKAVGVSGNDAEIEALYTHKIPTQYVRAGYLTVETYEEAKADFEKNGFPLHMQSIEQLRERAEKLDIQFSSAASSETLISLIEIAEKKAQPEAKSRKGKNHE